MRSQDLSTPDALHQIDGSAAIPGQRHEIFKFAERCREYAVELARYDQTRVNLPQCHKFNDWLRELKSYPLLAANLRTLQAARPIARWQVMVLALVAGLLLMAFLAARISRPWFNTFTYLYLAVLFIFYLLPERLYGTTVELLEGKVLRVVDVLEQLLQHGELDFTEAAFFQVKQNLEAARRELRQQIDLAHRR